jgi:hypothetical protein
MDRHRAVNTTLLLGLLSMVNVSVGSAQATDPSEEPLPSPTTVITGYFGILAPLTNLTEDAESFGTKVSLSIAVGGEVSYFLPSGLGFGVQGLFAPAKLGVEASDFPGAVPPALGNAKWFVLSGNLMYRLDLKGPAGVVEPFVVAGAGIRRLGLEAIASDQATTATDFAGNFGAGAFVLVSKSIAFRLEARDYISSFTSDAAGTSKVQHDVVVLTGVSFGL